MRKYLTIALLLFGTGLAKAQTTDTNTRSDTTIYTAVQNTATYPGGLQEFMGYLSKNIRYPNSARLANTQGRVFMSFVIEKDGSLSNFKILRGVSQDIDAEALRLMKESPKWIPAKQNDIIVRQRYVVPISFTLNK
jgi:protein TonB